MTTECLVHGLQPYLYNRKCNRHRHDQSGWYTD
jgi:hypothetical protein